jgi:ferredoxin-NADP reductase
MKLRVSERIQETPSTTTLRFTRTDGELPPFRAGQYLSLHLRIGHVLTNRAYSISSAPGEPFVDLTIRSRPDDYAPRYILEQAQVGEVFTSSGPRGHFHREPLTDGDELVFLAGGSGITPFMSMIRELDGQHFPQRVQLVYGSRFGTDVIFLDELKHISRRSKRCSLSVVLSDEPEGSSWRGVRGLVTADTIRKAIGRIDGKMFFLCGPPGFYSVTTEALAALEVPRHRIRRESFGPPSPVSQQAGWPVTVHEKDRFQVQIHGAGSFQAEAGESLLASLEKNGVRVRSFCRTGGCSACRVRVLSGQVFVPTDAGIRESDVRMGYTHSCVSFPTSDLVIRV